MAAMRNVSNKGLGTQGAGNKQGVAAAGIGFVSLGKPVAVGGAEASNKGKAVAVEITKHQRMMNYYELKLKELKLQEELQQVQQQLKELEQPEFQKPTMRDIIAQQQSAKGEEVTKQLVLAPEQPKPKQAWYVVMSGPKAGVFSEAEAGLINDQPKENIRKAQTKFEAELIMKTIRAQSEK
ncbi:hypothetical protein GOBAR_AA07652 [Gossypium barbadense]|uniref:Uncharacterized protein n=1 Tax=Gossypium barbadense TaxID=3634 RepID=A0A2P5YBW0_GOSBA|nr:hypothetical protein GOBAR_AA07652 [Gossypium barbadense]